MSVRGISGKFQRAGNLTTRDIINATRDVGNGCSVKHEDSNLGGFMRNHTWYIRGRRVITILWEDLHDTLLRGDTLARVCKTKGCLNTAHYKVKQLRTGEVLIMSDGAKAFYIKALQTGRAELRCKDRSEAQRMQMRIYTIRKKWKKNDPLFIESIKDLALTIAGEVLVCSGRNTDLDQLFEANGFTTDFETEASKPSNAFEAEMQALEAREAREAPKEVDFMNFGKDTTKK